MNLSAACGGGGAGGSVPTGTNTATLEWDAFLVTGTTYTYLTDNGIHAPPTTGPFSYNTFKPGAAGFPMAGGTYTDPVFGSVVRRLSAISGRNDDDIYSHHWANTNGTLAFAKGPVDTDIVEIASGKRIYTAQPDGSSRTDIAWDATSITSIARGT